MTEERRYYQVVARRLSDDHPGATTVTCYAYASSVQQAADMVLAKHEKPRGLLGVGLYRIEQVGEYPYGQEDAEEPAPVVGNQMIVNGKRYRVINAWTETEASDGRKRWGIVTEDAEVQPAPPADATAPMTNARLFRGAIGGAFPGFLAENELLRAERAPGPPAASGAHIPPTPPREP